MHHKSITLVVTIALLLSGSIAAVTVGASSHATVELAGPETVEPGETVTVTVRLDTATPAYGAQFRLSLSTPASGSVSKGSFLAGDASSVVVVREFSDTTVRYGETRTGAEDGVTGSGTLASIELTVPESTDADKLDLTFETVKVSDPDAQSINVSSQGLTIDIAGGSGSGSDSDSDSSSSSSSGGGANSGSSSSGGGGGSASSATTTQPTATPTDAWPAAVSSTVVSQFETASRVPVVIALDSGTEPAVIAQRLESSGATEVRVHADLNAVSATVSESTLRTVASRSDVRQVQYGSPATVTAASSGTTTTAPAGTETPASTAADETATATPAAGTTSTQFDLFGQPAIPLAVVLVGFLWWRRRLR